MTTPVHRLKAVCDALLNSSASTEQINRYAVAVANAEGRAAEFNAAATASDKAAVVMDCLRQRALMALKSYERQSAVAAATAASDAQVDADFAAT